MALAQTTVTDKVVSQEDGEPVIGASVRIVGTKTGTATDVDGNFTQMCIRDRPNTAWRCYEAYQTYRTYKHHQRMQCHQIPNG